LTFDAVAWAMIAAGSPPLERDTYQIHIPVLSKAEPVGAACTGSRGTGGVTGACASAGGAANASSPSRAAASARKRVLGVGVTTSSLVACEVS
jgi:hypothetical protein